VTVVISDPHREFPILIEALWSGEMSERDFVARCAMMGIAHETVTAVLNQLRTEDGIAA
jgi:hypothetical protein